MSTSPLDTDLLLRQTFVARVEHYATLGSTNDRAKECARHTEHTLPLLIVADRQTAGRGRGANRWWTGEGSLAVSLLLDAAELGLDRSRSPLVALAAAVAVVQTVAPLLPSRTVGVHWPNDVFAEGRKLAGILVEVPSAQRLAVGIGLNLNSSLRQAPQELQATATTLLDLTGVQHDRTEVLRRILDHLDAGLRRLAASPREIAARANAICLQRGQILTVLSGQVSTTGRCRGIAPDGALVLDTPQGPRTVYSGTVR
jgi:BirA family biotin operon repressor/biotin-[acetyl-CoA-carboxylase] ligase